MDRLPHCAPPGHLRFHGFQANGKRASRSVLALHALATSLLVVASVVAQEEVAVPEQPVSQQPLSATPQSLWTPGQPEYVEGMAVDAGPTPYDAGGFAYLPGTGAFLRARYNTQGYAQEEGNLDLGTMKLFRWDEGTASFIDGQVTMNDESGVGYNLGVGHRVIMPSLTPWEADAAKIYGISLWSDGSEIGKEKFFPQIGVSLEYLGDLWDVRANGYFPLEEHKFGEGTPTGDLGYSGNFLLQLTQVRRDTALTVGEVELARRLGGRDAWGFIGGYTLSGDEYDTEGYRIGARGYLLPDLLLQIAVTDDDLFHTNTIFSIYWFIGRTRSDYSPTGTLADRMREPVMRNDYVATIQSFEAGGEAMTDPETDEPIRIVHVNSSAPDGGDGTFEAPLNNLNNINANSQEGDVVLLYAESVFVEQTADLQIEQRLLGEGGDFENFVNTTQRGVIALPETSPGALEAPIPIIDNMAVDAVITRDLNEIANFTIDGGSNGIVAAMGGSGSAFIHDLTISNVTGDGISLTSFAREEEDETTTVSFNVTINEIEFENVGGNDIELDAFTNENLNSPDVNLDEVINVANVDSTDNGTAGLVLSNTHTGGTFNLNQYDYDGGAASTNGLLLTDIAGTVTAANTTISGGSATGVAIEVQNATNTVNFQSTVQIDGYAGAGVLINGGDAGTITFAGDIDDHTAGRSIEVTGRDGGTVTFSGTNNVDDDGAGIFVSNNTAGTINFQGVYDLDTTANDAVTVDNNTGATINFTRLNITTTEGDGFVATNGGTLGVTGATNEISTDTGRGLVIQDMTIAAGGASFNSVSVSNGATNGIVIENTTGGQVTIGQGAADGDGGMITTTESAIIITNAANVDLNDVQVVSSGGTAALVATHNNSSAFDLRVDNLIVDSATTAIDANADGSGAFTLFVTESELQSKVDFEGNGSGNINFTFQNSEVTTGNDDIAFRLELDSQVDDANITILNNDISTGDANAFQFVSGGSAKVVDLLFEDNSLTNNSGGNRTAQFQAQNATLLNATVRDNTFSNSLGAENLLIESVSGGTTINLDIVENTAVGGTSMFHLLITNGTFNVVDRDEADANNNNPIDFDPVIGDFGDIEELP